MPESKKIVTPLPALHGDLESLDPEVRRRAVLALGRVGGPESRDALERLLDDPDPVLYFHVRTALDQIAARIDASAVEPLAPALLRRALASGAESERRDAIARCLTAPRREHLPALSAHLSVESSPLVLPALVRAVLSFRDETTLEAGLAFLYHADARVRAAAVEGFWGWEHPKVHKAVLDRRADTAPRVKGDALVFAVLTDRRTASEQVRSMLGADRPWVRLAAVYVLGRVRREWATPVLSSILADPHQQPMVKDLAREVVSALSAGGAPDVAAPTGADDTVRNDLTRHLPAIADGPALVAALTSPDLLQRIHGLQNAHRFPAHVVVPVIYRMVDTEEDPLVIAALVRALGRTGGEDRIAMLGRFLEHEDPRVRANALEVVSQLDEELPRDHLDRLLSDEVPRVRLQAASYLFARRPEEALRFFRDMVFGVDPLSRESALFCLAKLKDDRVLDILRDALKDRRKDIYRQAYQILQNVAPDWPRGAALLEEFREGKVAGEVIEGEPVSALLAAVDSPNPIDRVATIKKLVAAEDPRVELMLEVSLAARDPAVRLQAAQALLQRHREKTLPQLERRLGALYLELVTGGQAVAPHAVARELAPTVRDLSAVDESELGGDERRDQLLALLGRELYGAWDRDVVLDEALREVCQDIRVIHELMHAHSGGAARPAGQVPGTPVDEPPPLDRAAIDAAVEAVANRPGLDAPAAPVGPAPEQQRRRLAALGGLWAVTLAFAYAAGQYGAGGTPEGARSATRTLDELSLERDPARFGARFRDRPVSFTATLVNAEKSGRNAQVRAGSILFRVAPGDLAQKIPDGLKEGALVDVTGRVQRLSRDGSVEVDGTLRPR